MIVRHQKGCWWRRRVDRAGASADDLLAAATVRFDFSAYTDIHNMVDVNGAWGPIVPAFIDESFDPISGSFTADGLRFVGAHAASRWKIEGVTSPLVFGADGLTVIQSVRVDVAGGNGSRLCNLDVAGDGNDSFSPELLAGWAVAVGQDDYGITLVDLAPGYTELVRQVQADVPCQINSASVTGVFVMAVVVDPAEAELRLTFKRTGPGSSRFDDAIPFTGPADFPSVDTAIDTIYCSVPGSDDFTLDEWAGWNSALTPAEIDALLDHLTA